MSSSQHAQSNLQAIPLVTLRISNGALASAPELPKRLKLLNWGENQSVKGPVKVGNKTAATLASNQRLRGFDKVALDFEHNTVPGSPEYERTKEPRPVAAYGVPVLVPGEGLFIDNLEWTPIGKSEAFNYADLSPAVERDETNEVLFMHSAALTRTGAVNELSFYSAASAGNQENYMDEKNVLTVAELAAALGLPANASKTDVVGKLTALSALAPLALHMKEGKLVILSAVEDKVAAIEKTLTAFPKPELLILSAATGADGKEVKLSTTELVALSTRVQVLETVVASQKEAAAMAERTGIISLFSAQGKVPKGADGKELSAEQLQALPVDSLKLLLANTPATVPLSPRGVRPKEGQQPEKLGHEGRAALYEKELASN